MFQLIMSDDPAFYEGMKASDTVGRMYGDASYTDEELLPTNSL